MVADAQVADRTFVRIVGVVVAAQGVDGPFAPLVALPALTVPDVAAAPDSPLARCVRRLVADIADDVGVISAFGSFVGQS